MEYSKANSILDEYELREEIGRGSYSVCRKCVHRSTRIEYAVKVSSINISQAFYFFSIRLLIK